MELSTSSTGFNIPALYAIADVDRIDPMRLIERMLLAGITLIQIRAKTLSDDALIALCTKAARLAGPASKIIVNDRIEVARTAPVAGVHLGQSDGPPRYARELLGPRALIGLSTHNIDQVRAAQQQPVDYLGFGPIYPSKTKHGHAPVTGTDLLREASALSVLPLVAIGGISAVSAPQVFAAGASSAAVVSDLEAQQDLAVYRLEFEQARLRAQR